MWQLKDFTKLIQSMYIQPAIQIEQLATCQAWRKRVFIQLKIHCEYVFAMPYLCCKLKMKQLQLSIYIYYVVHNIIHLLSSQCVHEAHCYTYTQAANGSTKCLQFMSRYSQLTGYVQLDFLEFTFSQGERNWQGYQFCLPKSVRPMATGLAVTDHHWSQGRYHLQIISARSRLVLIYI